MCCVLEVVVEGFVVALIAPRDAGALDSGGAPELVPLQSLRRRLGPRAKAISGPIVRAHQEHLRRLDHQRAQVLAAALGDAPEDRTAAGAVLSRHQAEPGTEIAPALKSLSAANRGDKTGRDHWPDAMYGHQPLAFSLHAAEFVDLAGYGVSAR